MSRPNQDTDKRVMERIKQQSADEHGKYMAKKMLSEKRQTIIDENHFLKGRIEELEARLELDEHGHDGVYCRDETIRLLEAQLAEIVTLYFDDCDSEAFDDAMRKLREKGDGN